MVAGVFGSERPVFDIIGEPIQTAFLLQKNGKPGNVHISRDTYDLVATNPFQFENAEQIILNDGNRLNTFNAFRKRSLGSYARKSSMYFSAMFASQKSDIGINSSFSSQAVNVEGIELSSHNSTNLIHPSLSDTTPTNANNTPMINLTINETEIPTQESTSKTQTTNNAQSEN